MNHYEQAGLIFYSEKNHLMASSLFIKGLEKQPENSMLWYGLGDSFCHISAEMKQQALYDIGISCFKKSYSISSNNEYSISVLENLKKHPSYGVKYINELKIATLDLVSKFKMKIPDAKLISYFDNIKNLESKIKIIMHLGDNKDYTYFNLLKNCILNSENNNIRFSALKRISFFKSENLKGLFDEIINRDAVKKNEPYFSIALSSIGENWTTNLINPDFSIQNNQEKSFTKEEIANSLNDDNIKAVIALSLIKYDKKEVQHLFENQNHQTIAFYLTNRMNEDGINLLINKNILNHHGKVSELGWKHIEEFLKFNFKQSEEPTKKDSDTSENPVVRKKWWKIWK